MTKSLPTIGGLWKTGSIYILSFGFNSALPILLTPILTRFLSPSDYGVTAMWQVLLSFTLPLIGFSTQAAVNRRYFYTNDNPQNHRTEMRDYIASLIPILAGTAVFVMLVYLLTYPLIIEYLLPTKAIWILAIPFVAVATFFFNVTQSYLNAEMRAKTNAFFNSLNVILASAFGLIFVVGYGWHWQGRVGGGILGTMIMASVVLAYLYHRNLLGGQIRWGLTRHALLFSLPLLPHILTFMARGVSDRVFLSQIADLHEIGLFSVALSLTGIFNLLGNAATQAWLPWLYSHLGDRDVDRRRIVKITYIALAALAGSAIVFVLIAPFIFSFLLGPRFEESVKYVWWLTAASVLQGAYYFVAPYISYSERNKYSSYISMATLVVNISLNFFLIGQMGVMGVAAANFFTALFELVAIFIFANYCVPMPWVSVFFRSAPALSDAADQGGKNP